MLKKILLHNELISGREQLAALCRELPTKFAALDPPVTFYEWLCQLVIDLQKAVRKLNATGCDIFGEGVA